MDLLSNLLNFYNLKLLENLNVTQFEILYFIEIYFFYFYLTFLISFILVMEALIY